MKIQEAQDRRADLMTIAETAEYLGIAQTTLWDMRKKKLGPPSAKMPGLGIRYRKVDVDGWVEAQFND